MNKIVSIIVIVILTIGCTTTITKTNNPVFSKAIDSLPYRMAKLVQYENMNLNGIDVTTNGKSASELEIDVTNGNNIPADETQMIDLAKQIATIIKESLKNKNQYDTYKVLFIVKKESNGLTERTWKGKVFKSQEL